MKNKYIFLTFVVIWIVVCLILFHLSIKDINKISGEYVVKTTNQNIELNVELIEVNDKTTFTAYTLSVEETDSSPYIGAGNNNLYELKKTMNICASRDLPLDTLVYIDGFGECVIKDRLNKRYKGTNRIDILMETRKEALKFGKQQLNYAIVK